MSLSPSQGNREPLGLHRWYDRDFQLGEMVAAMQKLSPESRTLFAYLILYLSQDMMRRKGRRFFRELGWGQLLGISKARHGRRWYDQEPLLWKAFHQLYSLGVKEQALIAGHLRVPARLVREYETWCAQQGQPISMDRIQGILAFSFKEGPGQAMDAYFRAMKQINGGVRRVSPD